VKITAPLVLLTLGLLLAPARAEEGCRLLTADGTITIDPDGTAIAADEEIPYQSRITVGPDSSARIALPGVGILELAPSSVFALVRGSDGLGVVLFDGEGSLALGGGGVRLAVAGGRLEVRSPTGYGAILGPGDNGTFETDASLFTVAVTSGAIQVEGHAEYVLLNSGEMGRFGRRPGPPDEWTTRLRNRDIEIALPPEALKDLSGREAPDVVEDLEESWNRGRESPRVP
jgi:hypothetical protein